jgi:hypothetical protein
VWPYWARARMCPNGHAMLAQEALCGAQAVLDL